MSRAVGVGVEAEVRQPVEQGADADGHLGPGHVHAQADVGAAAEAHRRLQRPGDVVLVGALPPLGVAVGRAEAEVEHGALGDLDAAQLGVLVTQRENIGSVGSQRSDSSMAGLQQVRSARTASSSSGAGAAPPA